MGDMYCEKCYRFGIYWKNLGSYNEHTFCPHCRGINCQQVQEEFEEQSEINKGD